MGAVDVLLLYWLLVTVAVGLSNTPRGKRLRHVACYVGVAAFGALFWFFIVAI